MHYSITFLVLVFQTVFLHCYAQCPDGYSSMGGMCIMMGQRVPWEKAQAACVKENATIIATRLKDQWDQAAASIPAAQLTGVWFGLHYDKASDKWSWSDGSPYDPAKDWAPWGTDQPNTKQGECVVIKIDTKKENKPFWFMGSCAQALTGVCVKAQQTTIGTGTPFTMPSFPNVTCPPGLMAFAGQCMKYTQDPTTYADATAACIANNSYVLFTKDPTLWSYAEYGIGSQLTNFWIGLSYDEKSKQFVYSNGDVYNAATDWAPWAKDNPGTPGAWAGNCVGVQQDYATSKYQWIMVDCMSGLNGVCLYNMPTTPGQGGATPPAAGPVSAAATQNAAPPNAASTGAPAAASSAAPPNAASSGAPAAASSAAPPNAASTGAHAAAPSAATPPPPSAPVPVSPSAEGPATPKAGATPPAAPASAAPAGGSSAAANPSAAAAPGSSAAAAAPASAQTLSNAAATPASAAKASPVSQSNDNASSPTAASGASAAVSSGAAAPAASMKASVAPVAANSSSSAVGNNGSTATNASATKVPGVSAASHANANPTLGPSSPASPLPANGSPTPTVVPQATSSPSAGAASAAAANSAPSKAPAAAGASAGDSSGAAAAGASTKASVAPNAANGSTSAVGNSGSDATRAAAQSSVGVSSRPSNQTVVTGQPAPVPSAAAIAALSSASATSNSSTSAPACYRIGRFLPAPENGRLAFMPFETTNTTDSTECGQACLMRTACESFDYNKSTRECRFFAYAFADDCTQFIKDANFQHFDLTSSDLA